MKRFSVIFVVLALCLSLCACGGPSDTYVNDELFERVKVFDDCIVYRHIDTNVLYVYIKGGGGFTVMFNADGTPQTWKGY
jgi:hypothetical protein